jgi:pyrroloquinoline quinone biosynthesis protein D
MKGNSYPSLACGVRLFWDDARQQHFLLFPEGAMKINQTAREILDRCDRQHSVDDIIAELTAQFPQASVEADVYQLLTKIAQRGLIQDATP